MGSDVRATVDELAIFAVFYIVPTSHETIVINQNKHHGP